MKDYLSSWTWVMLAIAGPALFGILATVSR